MAELIINPRSGYRFLKGIDPYSSGVIAAPNHEIVHTTLARPLPWHAGLLNVRKHLESNGLRHHDLCAVELRCPRPHSMNGFIDFNSDYRALLEEWGVLVDGLNPIARTNVAPVANPPSETMLHAFSWVRPATTDRPTFVVAGGGELPHRDLDRSHIVRVGDDSEDAMREKAECVIRIMQHRLKHLGANEADLTSIDIYTAHQLRNLLEQVVFAGLPTAAQIGVHWYLSRPPIEDIEFEMDMRGVAVDSVLDFRNKADEPPR